MDFATHKFFLERADWRDLPRTLTLVADPWRADVCVVADPANPPACVLWTIALKGGHVVTKDFVMKRQGLCFTYGSAILTKRSIFIDPQFAEEDPDIASVVRRMCLLPQSKWKLLRDWQGFAKATDLVAGVHLPVRSRREMEVLALASEAVVQHMGRKNICNKIQFMLAIARLACTQRGLCGQ